MSEECTHDCSSCGNHCSSHTPESLIVSPCEGTKIGKIIGVVSGKGGVGKSIVTDMLAVNLAKKGFRVGILDADITGPSIPKAFGIAEKADSDEEKIYPVLSKKLGIKIISINSILADDTDPVVWRGPIIAGVVKQFYTDVLWGELDYLLVDMPPGTGDVPLTVFQSITVDGIIVVSSPQELVSMIVEKAMKMAEMMDVPVKGMIENMSYLECPDCGKKISIFGESHVDEIACSYGIPVLAKIPIKPELAAACDAGTIETADVSMLDEAVAHLG